jgi:transketolase
MINKNLKLNPNLFEKEVEQAPIRKGFGEGLLILGEENKDVVGLCADLTDSTYMNLFRKKFPERFVEIGVAEQNLATVASGMSAMGKIPFISSYATFSPGRNWEQIRTTICYNNRKVIIVGSHGGVSVGPDGGSHQALEDIAITRVLPNMTVISPADYIEARKATVASVSYPGPIYIRLAREKTPVITTEETPFEIGKAEVFYEGDNEKSDVTIIATGALVFRALKVAKKLGDEGLKIDVINLHTIKPLDERVLLEKAKKSGAFVTVEEHQVVGGMGSAVSEFISKNYPIPIEFVGVQDKFGQTGKPEELISFYQMDEDSIEKAVKKVLLRKK